MTSIQEAEMAVAWNRANEYEKALVRCLYSENDDADIILLANTIEDIDPDGDIEEVREQVHDYVYNLKEEEGVSKWFEIRMDAGFTILGSGGIFLLGAVETLIDRKGFDDEGVMRGLVASKD
ncbi:unnamed protein product [Aureobasidium uvarum]|uniref:Uncharacterized protein n=1 Tax=Aureobasidium uvarum TaxID=2773716 RepID=A0A9N8PWR2_9PEZI|nr:unnamed protein product [Aureobasidium uvarum]